MTPKILITANLVIFPCRQNYAQLLPIKDLDLLLVSQRYSIGLLVSMQIAKVKAANGFHSCCFVSPSWTTFSFNPIDIGNRLDVFYVTL